jgi:hypothetical protein
MTQSLIFSLKTRIKRLKQITKIAEENGLSLVLNEDAARLDENEVLLNFIEKNGITIYDVVQPIDDAPDEIIASYLTEKSAIENRKYSQVVVQRKVVL